MSKRSAAKRKSFVPYLSALPGGNGEYNFIMVPPSLLRSDKFHSINYAARFVFLCMCIEAKGKDEVLFAEATATKLYGIPTATLRKSIGELISNNIISYATTELVRGKPARYRFNKCAWREDAIQPAAKRPPAPKPP